MQNKHEPRKKEIPIGMPCAGNREARTKTNVAAGGSENKTIHETNTHGNVPSSALHTHSKNNSMLQKTERESAKGIRATKLRESPAVRGGNERKGRG